MRVRAYTKILESEHRGPACTHMRDMNPVVHAKLSVYRYVVLVNFGSQIVLTLIKLCCFCHGATPRVVDSVTYS